MARKAAMVTGTAVILLGIGIYLYPNIREWELNIRTQKLIAEFNIKYSTEDETANETIDVNVKDAANDTLIDTVNDIADDTDEYNLEDTGSVEETEKPFQALYEEILAYNEKLVENGQQLVDAWSYAQEPIDLSELSGDDGAVGYIQIPAMDVTLPLYIGATTENMAKGAAVMSETSMPIGGENTNCVVAGHRGYSGMPYFREIEKLETEDYVYVTNPWETMIYAVTEISIIDPDDVDSILIRPGKDMVTLLTCHPYMGHGKYRYVVYCERVEEDDASGLPEETSGGVGALADAENFPSTETQAGPGTDDGLLSSGTVILAEKILRVAVPVAALLVLLVAFVRRRKGNGQG